MRCTDYELLYLRAEGRRNVFLDRPFRRDGALSFYGYAAMIRPLAFSTIIKKMKVLLHNA